MTEPEILALNGKFVLAPGLRVWEQLVTFGGGHTPFHVTVTGNSSMVTLRSQESPPRVVEVDKKDVVRLIGPPARVERDYDPQHEQLELQGSLEIAPHATRRHS